VRRALAGLCALGVAACAHSSSQPEPLLSVKGNGIKHAVQPMSVAGDVDSALPAVFEQAFCGALFDFNDKNVICPEDVRAYIQVEREKSAFGNEERSLEAIAESFSAPRIVALNAAGAGELVLFSAVVQTDKGQTLDRFEVSCSKTGRECLDRARELAAKVATIP